MRIYIAFAVLFFYAILCYACWWHYRRCQRKTNSLASVTADTYLIAYASQGGTAAQIAWQSADQLSEAGLAVQVLSLNRVDHAALQSCKRILLIVSTFGEGEAPDNGNRILPRLAGAELSHLSYGLLALGDSSYRLFCGFGHALDHALQLSGATPLFDLIEVDRSDPAALRHWQYYLGQISGQSHFHDWQAPDYDNWTLAARHCINQGSPGAPAFWLQLTADSSRAIWQAGDIAEIGPCNSTERVSRFLQLLGRDVLSHQDLAVKLRRRELPDVLSGAGVLHLPKDYRALTDEELVSALPELPHREYSIASIPESGTLDLLVRQISDSEGQLGLGSGWLTQYAQVGSTIALRIRSNPAFHPPAPSAPLILLGNGTGMAGLRAHLLARKRVGGKRNWLLFGERAARHDFFFAEDIRRWQSEGFIEHLDLVFSRDAQAQEPRYVQDILPLHAERLRSWVAEGAAIYVCGSLQGMAQGVDLSLTQILGRDALDALAETHRYCRDVY